MQMERKKKAGVAVLISNKIDFKTKAIVRDKEGHYLMIKGTIQQEDITLVNIYVPNTGTPKCVKQILMDIKGEIEAGGFGWDGREWWWGNADNCN